MVSSKINPRKNYEKTREAVGYVARRKAAQADYDRIGFRSGLEVHQQLKTGRKLFCRCTAGLYNESDDFDAELVRHMRPTLSELGEYDGTALMEFKTRKEIVYRIKNDTACTYEVDDTPPFPVDRESLDIALEIALLCKMNIVGEVHITRKQYLDGSIPTGFQRTAIIGVEGEIYLRDRPVRLLQLSLEEDSCREISDVGHVRKFKTDRLGMPLIETVTYPDCRNPEEVREACDYIRFLNRTTGKVRTGIGTGRQDVNVSCRGGTRVEIKGVSHTKWIPELTHNECFRQWALLRIAGILGREAGDPAKWRMVRRAVSPGVFTADYKWVRRARKMQWKIVCINLPHFKSILSHFTQPGRVFADEISDRLKVIACIEKPNLVHSEELKQTLTARDLDRIRLLLKSRDDDAQLILWGPKADIPTALETVEERCKMAFAGVPSETRKCFRDGTTMFERVLPGPDRMYPDTDSAPIPLEDEHIERIRTRLPSEVRDRLRRLQGWGVPEDTHRYILSRNHFPLIEEIARETGIQPRWIGTFFGHHLKHVEGRFQRTEDFDPRTLRDMFRFLIEQGIEVTLARRMLPVIYQHPKMDFESVLTTIGFRKVPREEILLKIPFLREKYRQNGRSDRQGAEIRWIMGQLHEVAVGNMNLRELRENVQA
jgi:glutamyl-tRNA(Gln) amidotransferase subunit E